MDFISYEELHEMFFFKQVDVNYGGSCKRPHVLSEYFEYWLLNVISSCLLLFLPFFVGPGYSILSCVFTLQGSFQLTHSVSVITQMRKSKIATTVISHSSRSASLLSKIEILDCSAWGRIDQYHFCLLYIELVDFIPVCWFHTQC